MTRDIPIIFSGPMVRALLDGRKTMTRRLAWRTPRVFIQDGEGPIEPIQVPSPWQKVKPGDRLWVRENFARISVAPIVESIDKPWTVFAAADNRTDYGGPWKPSIHMPRSASRITLVVTGVKIERLQDISEADVIAEGCKGVLGPNPDFPDEWDPTPVEEFGDLWRSLHGADAWDANPYVVALTFTVHRCNIDALPKARVA